MIWNMGFPGVGADVPQQSRPPLRRPANGTTRPVVQPRWRRLRMLFWVLLLGPFGILAYYYRWARFTFLIIAGLIWIYAGGLGGLIVGLAFFVLPAVAFAKRVFRAVRS
jgi:hypothetical protein